MEGCYPDNSVPVLIAVRFSISHSGKAGDTI
jgi:hypothetical protein